MSIVSVTEQYGGRGTSLNNVYERIFTRVFEVETSDSLVGPLAVRLASGIPHIGTPYTNGLSIGHALYEFDNGAFVNEIRVDEITEGGGIAWKVTVQYGPWNPATFGSDPTLWPLRVTFGGERTERVCDFDKTGAPIRNSAGDRFGDPVVVDDHISTLTITRNELVSSFDPDTAADFSDTVNNATWNGRAARYCKMGLITTSEEKFDSNAQVWYYTVTYPVSIGRKPWVKEIMDMGFNELDAYGSSAKPIMHQGQPLSDPVPLDGSGRELTGGYVTPVTLTYYVFDEADWSVLGINLSVRLGL
jgi:hypothetical protein